MIKTFKDSNLENCWKWDKCSKINQIIKRRVLMKLDSMDAANCLEDLLNPPSNHLHSLRGDLKGYWAISVNGPWRLLFRYEQGDIFDVYLEQYH